MNIKKLLFSSKRRIASTVGATAIVLAGGGIAGAFLTASTATGTGHALGPVRPHVKITGQTFRFTTLGGIFSAPFYTTNPTGSGLTIGYVTVTSISTTHGGNCNTMTNPTWFTITAAVTKTTAPPGTFHWTQPTYTTHLPHIIIITTPGVNQNTCATPTTFTLTFKGT